MSDQDQDIQEALTTLNSEEESNACSTGNASHGAIALKCPSPKNPLSCLWWGFAQSNRKMGGLVRRHPWWGVLGIFLAIACAQFVSIYLGFIVLTGLMIWALKYECP